MACLRFIFRPGMGSELTVKYDLSTESPPAQISRDHDENIDKNEKII